jgi:hypothetical protein
MSDELKRSSSRSREVGRDSSLDAETIAALRAVEIALTCDQAEADQRA